MSKSAITPSFSGRMAMMLPGVLPTMALASAPTARGSRVFLSMATTDGRDDDALASDIDQRVGRAQVDAQVPAEQAEQSVGAYHENCLLFTLSWWGRKIKDVRHNARRRSLLPTNFGVALTVSHHIPIASAHYGPPARLYATVGGTVKRTQNVEIRNQKSAAPGPCYFVFYHNPYYPYYYSYLPTSDL